MNRRYFLRTSFLTSVAVGVGISNPLKAKSQNSLVLNPKRTIDPVIPLRFYPEEEERIFSQMIEMKEKYGLRKFLLTGPMDEIKLKGYPSNEVYQDLGKQVLYVKEKLKDHGIEIGWWCAPSLRSGPNAPFQYVTDISGIVADSTPCPLDPKFKEDFSTNVATVVQIARPFRVQFEDDYELSWQPPNVNFGCFCPLHLAEFSKRQNKKYTREDLLEIFKEVSPESKRLREAWAELSKDTLVAFATAVREKVDKIAPTTSICLCQSGCSDLDGNFTEEVARAFAGNTQPSVRLFGANYSNDDLLSLPGTLFHALYSKEHLPDDFECLHETDSYPHTRYFTSANTMKSWLTCIFSYGYDNTLFYATQYLDNPLEERSYVEMYKNESIRLSTLKESVKDCVLEGCQIPYYPLSHILNPYRGNQPYSLGNAWVNLAGRFGIPYTTKNDENKVKLLAGQLTEMMTDNEVKDLLTGGVFLDALAAELLYKRGFGELIGVSHIVRGTEANFSSEGIRNPEKYETIEGRLMYNLIFAPAGAEGGSFFKIEPLNNAEIVTDFLDPDKNPVIPGMMTFENKLGGRVAIIAFELSKSASSTIYNYKKKELIRQTINWLGHKELPVCIMHHPNVFCIFNQAKNNKYGIMTVTNMTADRLDSLHIIVADEWKNAKIQLLDTDGSWKTTQVNNKKETKEVIVTLETSSPVILKLVKA